MCANFRFSIFSRSDDIVAEVKGATLFPPAAGGWRGGPAAAGLTMLKLFLEFDLFPTYRYSMSGLFET